MKGGMVLTWFEDQFHEREAYDRKLLEESFIGAAGIVYGQKISDRLLDKSIITEQVIDELLKYYHFQPVKIPNTITDSKAQLDYCLRKYGLMKRKIKLQKDWFADAFGPILAYSKDGEEAVVLLPNRFGRHYSFRDQSGCTVRVNATTAELFQEDAYCFYKPLPQQKLRAADLILYMKGCMQTNDICLLVGSTLLMSLVGVMIPQIVKVLTGVIAIGENYGLLHSLALCTLCIIISIHLFGAVIDATISKIRIKTMLQMQSAIMMRILSLPVAFFRKFNPGQLADCSAAVNHLCELLIKSTVGTGLTTLAALLYLIPIFRFTPELAASALIIIILTVGFGMLSAVIQTRISTKQMELSAQEAHMRYNVISGIQKIKLAGAEKRFFAKWLSEYNKSRAMTYSPPLWILLQRVFSIAISLFSYVILYYIAISKQTEPSNFLAFSVAFSLLLGALRFFSDAMLSLGKIRPFMKTAEFLLQANPETTNEKKFVTELSGNIDLNNVFFRYSNTSPYLLKGISLKIRSGEYIAVVGRTGCGKSTLVKLLLGFEVPEKGAIYYSGSDVNALDLSSLRHNIGTVMQDSDLFQGDIYSNITISAPKATMEDAWEAAENAGIAEDIREMPMQMHTLISAGQGGISGGQKQRILIARALVGKPRILIFDEATSALDNITQRHISNALDKLKCTRIVIAHRLSTVRHCSRILVLDDGVIAEDGTYDELLARNGIFAELVKRQRTDL